MMILIMIIYFTSEDGRQTVTVIENVHRTVGLYSSSFLKSKVVTCVSICLYCRLTKEGQQDSKGLRGEMGITL
jgi:hypothetical protein